MPFCHLSSFIWSQQVESLNGKKRKIAAIRAAPSQFQSCYTALCLCSSLPLRQTLREVPREESGKYLACSPSPVMGEGLVDKLRRQSGCSGILITDMDDEFALKSNSCTGNAHPRLIVDEREP